jgi:CheY-like chemotaxis protein
MAFTNRLVNRRTFPIKHVVVCEDDLDMQAAIAAKFCRLFDPQGTVQVSFVPGAVQAAALIEKAGAELILLDHDMPFGNGIDLMEWLKEIGFINAIPVITFSGIMENNDALMAAGASYRFQKSQVISGEADDVIKKILNL